MRTRIVFAFAALALLVWGAGSIIPAGAAPAPGLSQTVEANIALATPTVGPVVLATLCQDRNKDGSIDSDTECTPVQIYQQGQHTKLLGLRLHYHLAGAHTLPTVRADAGSPDQCKGKAGVLLSASGAKFTSNSSVTVTTTDSAGTSQDHQIVQPGTEAWTEGLPLTVLCLL